jgi:hypothetical protein
MLYRGLKCGPGRGLQICPTADTLASLFHGSTVEISEICKVDLYTPAASLEHLSQKRDPIFPDD